ncbi:hypothetical protein D9C73_019131 [Collichthys lucidus]|uniref:AIG1-type G domain-containing protein n=1 Tax=Collichthys lucidus TaxID=240159 RepID=A0A4V6XYW3_COLLU|nr:hypothetical protein D9C73_019131 [Collichthys lucidus]
MALSYPGPNLFILADNSQEENVVAQISKLQGLFGEGVTAHLVVMVPDIERFSSLSHLKELFRTRMAIANENLANECKSGVLVIIHSCNITDEVFDNIFIVVLLGLTGTGKSESANTILTAGNPNPGLVQLFKSEPSSMTVTMHCEVRITEQPFGGKVRLVDTPDFFHDKVKNSQVQECGRSSVGKGDV